jgi:hypothetical protein
MGDGDGKGVSGSSGDSGCNVEWLGGRCFKGVVGGVWRGGLGMNGNRCRASARPCKARSEDEHGVDEILLYSEGVLDIELLGRCGRLWW